MSDHPKFQPTFTLRITHFVDPRTEEEIWVGSTPMPEITYQASSLPELLVHFSHSIPALRGLVKISNTN